jgi:choline dehydrogenase-like flavoprotein
VLVIGAGASGSIAVRYLAERGFKVVCLEQGAWVNPSEYPGDKPEWELLAQKQWHPNPNVRDRQADYPCETSDSDVNPLMFAAVGGSTLLYAAHWCRQAPSDFRVRTLDGIADDWPFTYEDLLPYYERVELDLGVAGLGGDPAYPPSAPPPLPAHPINKMGRTAAKGMNELGWHWWPAPNSIPTRDHGNMKQCVRYGTCLTGCPEGAKASYDLAYWPGALAHGARLVTGARVREITTDDRGRATGAVWIDRDGAEHHQAADVVVVACNGVGTPRLLRLSSSPRFPDGLANSSGLVGKRLMMHPYAAIVGLYADQLDSWIGPSGQTIQSMEFYETDTSRGFVRGAKWQVMPTGGPLGMRSGYGGGPVEERWGANLHRNLREQFGHSFEWGIIVEDLPEESNYVTLDPTVTDSDGLPAPKIVYRNSDNTREMIRFNLDRVQEAHDAAGAFRTIVTPLMRDSGWHLLGTACMGADPVRSVVDEWCRSHDVPNLYIIDGSVFPTSSGVNPTATISAVALRAVERIVERAGLQEVPA